MWIPCPFHNEKIPSLSINVGRVSIPLGVFHCFGCNRSGSWNVLAEYVGMKLIKSSKPEEVEDQLDDPFEMLEDMLDAETVDTSVPKNVLEWRGKWTPDNIEFDEKLLRKLKAKKWFDKKSEIFRILFPVTLNKKSVGYVSHRLDDHSEPKHRNCPGPWAKKYFIGYDFIKPGTKSIALVEGSSDWIRMTKEKIPTLGLLGAHNWSKKKLAALVSLGVEKTVLFLDGDRAGYEASEKIEKHIRKYMEVEVVKLPSKKGYVKLDPGNCPRKFIEKVRSKL